MQENLCRKEKQETNQEKESPEINLQENRIQENKYRKAKSESQKENKKTGKANIKEKGKI